MIPNLKDRILLINYDFPPTLSGVRRVVKMTQYLPESGFEPVVLAASPAARGPHDYEALNEIEKLQTKVWRTASPDLDHLGSAAASLAKPFRLLHRSLDLSAGANSTDLIRMKPPRVTSRLTNEISTWTRRILALPDDRFPWLTTAIPMASHLLHSQAIRYVLTSSYPNSTHLIGLYLKRRFNVHWHADFRDGWTQNPYFANYLTPVHRRLNSSLEAEVARMADTITAVSEPIADHLSGLSGKNNVYVLPNGFDPNDLESVPVLEFDRFTLAYTGTMFMQRSPDSFFAAVRGLLDSYPGLADNFQVIFRSNMKSEHTAMIHDLGLENVVHNWGMGTWRESLSLQKSADALLVLEGENPNSHIMLTQKIFEYLAAEKPILAVTPGGALAELVRRSRAGVVVHPENVFRIKETLFELFLGRMHFRRNPEVINAYTRQAQARQLAEILRS